MSAKKVIRNGVPVPLWDMALLSRQLIHPSRTPENGFRCAAVDTALGNSPKNDESAFVFGLVQTDKQETPRSVLWLVSATHGRFEPRALVREFGKFFAAWTPQRSCCEKINGSNYLQLLVEDEFERIGIDPAIDWFSARNADAKANRISRLVKLHLQDRLRIVAKGEWVDSFLRECESWTGTSVNKGRQDNLQDAASMLVGYIAA